LVTLERTQSKYLRSLWYACYRRVVHHFWQDLRMINPSDIHIHLHLEPDREVLARLDVVLQQLGLMETKIMAAIDDLQATVTAEDTVIDGAVALLNGIPALIAAAGTDPAKLTALQTDIQTHTASLAAAVIVGTPVATAGGTPVTPQAAQQAARAATS
jgi:hypothetical protein